MCIIKLSGTLYRITIFLESVIFFNLTSGQQISADYEIQANKSDFINSPLFSLILQVFQIMNTLVTTLATMTTMVTTNRSPMRKKRKKFNMTSTFSTLVVRW